MSTSTLNLTRDLELAPDIGPAPDYDTEPTGEAFDLITGESANDRRYPCQGCGGDGWIEWSDHVEGPCVVCQA